MAENDQPHEEVTAKVNEGLTHLAPHLKSWVSEHLIEPRRIRLAIDVEGTSFKDLWLITNHTGENDSSYRVAYNGESQQFGLECTLASGVEWYMGDYGSFAEAVENM